MWQKVGGDEQVGSGPRVFTAVDIDDAEPAVDNNVSGSQRKTMTKFSKSLARMRMRSRRSYDAGDAAAISMEFVVQRHFSLQQMAN